MTWAIILAGGKGERLRPFTEDRPKPMVEILGIPILGYQIQWLQAQGVTNIIIACGYRHEVIRDYFGEGAKWGVHIQYRIESSPLGRGGAIRKSFELLPEGEELVVATNGDIITNCSLQQLVETHVAKKAIATIVLTPFVSPYGLVETADDSLVVGFTEKPELPYWINGGIYVFSREIQDFLPTQGDHEDSTFPQLAAMGRLVAYKSRSYWKSVDTVKDLSEVNKELERRLIASFLTESPSL